MALPLIPVPATAAPATLAGTHLPVRVYPDSELASAAVARQIADLIRARAAAGQPCVLGLATGSSPTRVYEELVRLHREEGLSFQNVVSFNLDEYYPMAPDSLQSYVRFMREYLFDHVDIRPENVHIPDGTVPPEQVAAFCQRYEERIREAGGIDLQLLGIGRTGHIGFNEPGSGMQTRTRMVVLDSLTRADAAGEFFGLENVPARAITMGVGTIMDAREVVLMVSGARKAAIVAQAIEEKITSNIPASFLREHPNATFWLDEAAATQL